MLLEVQHPIVLFLHIFKVQEKMKRFLIFIFIIFFTKSIGQGIANTFEAQVLRDGNELVIEVRNITNNSSLPVANDQLTDLSLSLIFPTSANVSFGNITNGVANMVTSGTVQVLNSTQSFQTFGINSPSTIQNDWIQNTFYEMFRVEFTASSATSGDNADIASFGVVSIFEPVINFNASPDYYDLPSVQSAPLPIIMKTFSATRLGERSARLDWVTSSEVNSAYFGVERSKDALVWENIGYVQAAGNSDTEKSYEFVDDQLPLGRNASPVFYYRLKLVDLDGKFNYSDIRGVNFRNSFDGIIKVYPNPTVSNIHIDLSGWEDAGENTSLHIFDSTGKSMLVKDIIGQGIELIDVSAWPSGSYHINVSHNGQTDHHRFVKVD